MGAKNFRPTKGPSWGTCSKTIRTLEATPDHMARGVGVTQRSKQHTQWSCCVVEAGLSFARPRDRSAWEREQCKIVFTPLCFLKGSPCDPFIILILGVT